MKNDVLINALKMAAQKNPINIRNHIYTRKLLYRQINKKKKTFIIIKHLYKIIVTPDEGIGI